MKTTDKTTPIRDKLAASRSTMDDPLLPWRRPDPTPFRLVELGADVLDGNVLRLAWWPEGVAYVLDPEGTHRTVLSVPGARRVAATILEHLDALELDLAGEAQET